MYSESEVSKIIDECFSLGQGGWNCEDDKEEYKEMIAQFCNELKNPTQSTCDSKRRNKK